ncbi:MAG: hypothetical protein HY527_15635 [Betaproteobacteria bacterium]|nr:hypothetical protein [Betaproteobacteria bacterium]
MTEFIVNQWWLVAIVIASLIPLVMRIVSAGLLETLRTLDRRWIFLLLLWAVLIPIYFIGVTGRTFPEVPSVLARATFDEIDRLNPGDPILLAFDYDPPSEGELGPMATAFVYHAASKKLRMYFMALWPLGAQMIDNTIAKVITPDFRDLVYGRDYINLGFKSGQEGVIKVVVTNLRELYTTDSRGTAMQDIPMMEGITNIQQMKVIVSVSAGYPGTKEWVQYAVTPFPSLRLVAGATGVQAPLLYPYVPRQLPGLLGAIKGAAEYEKLVVDAYGGANADPKYLEALRRMGPQLVAHLLIITLIVVANVVFLMDRGRKR